MPEMRQGMRAFRDVRENALCACWHVRCCSLSNCGVSIPDATRHGVAPACRYSTAHLLPSIHRFRHPTVPLWTDPRARAMLAACVAYAHSVLWPSVVCRCCMAPLTPAIDSWSNIQSPA
jgi:hypothetical protein